MGKGIPAALIGAALKSELLRYSQPDYKQLLHSHRYDRGSHLLSVSKILELVHDQILPSLFQLEYFACLLYGRFDFTHRVFTYVDCGSTKPLVYKKRTGEILELRGSNFPIGMVEDNNYKAFHVTFDPGDIFVFYSDGVTEARNIENEQFGIEKLTALLKEFSEEGTKNLVEKIKKAIFSFTDKDYAEDDLTLVILKIEDHIHDLHKSLKRLTKKFLANLSNLSEVREFIKSFCDRLFVFNESFIQELQLAINEVFCNIVEHGYRGVEGLILIEIQNIENGILVQIKDQAPSFDPSHSQEMMFDENSERGRGLFIIKHLTDEISYLCKTDNNDWNCLQIYKSYSAKGTSMEITHNFQHQVLTISLQNDSLDASNSTEFKNKVFDLLKNNQKSSIIFDLNALHFIDSSGLGSFVSILKNVKKEGCDVKLARMNKAVRAAFEVVRMHRLFEIYPSTEEAISSFNK